MKAGYFEKNLNRMRAIYKAKHDFMLAELRKYPWVLNIMGENSGLHLLVEVGTTLTEQGVIQKCAEQKNSCVRIVRVLHQSESEAGVSDFASGIWRADRGTDCRWIADD